MKIELQNFLLLMIIICSTIELTVWANKSKHEKEIIQLKKEIVQKDSIIHSFLGTGTE